MNAELSLALHLADAADAITAARFRAPGLQVDTKPDQSVVTEADLAVERALRDILARERPAHGIAGEEFGTAGNSDWRWYLDPIDGTINYARGIPVWATLIALRENDEPVCAVVSAPGLHRRWWASRGEGAHSRESGRIQVSSAATLEEAYLSTTDARDFDGLGLGDGYRSLAARCHDVRAFGDFWTHMLVAEGVIDLGPEPLAKPWDLAAPQLIVEEAGGTFTDLAGRRRIDSGNALSSNALLHPAALAELTGKPRLQGRIQEPG
ncbi:MAG: inositol monophosphatase family protein [Candidatus Dormibacteria bacterium]